MKKLFILLLTIVTLSQVSYSQNTLQFVGGDTISLTDFGLDIYETRKVKNTGSDTINVVWVRYDVWVSDTNWSTAICDKKLCWDTIVSSKSFKLAPGEEGDLYPHFYTKCVKGEGSLKIRVYEDENPLNADTAFFKAEYGWCIGIDKVDYESITLYPNPASNSVTIELSTNMNNGVVEVYDIMGNKVLSNELISNKQTIDVATLSQGMYIIRLLDAEGNLYSKRFQKI